MTDLQDFRAVLCGTCSFAFEEEAGLRQHQTEPDEDCDLHDGEPWHYRTIRVGERVVWERNLLHAFAVLTIRKITMNEYAEVWIEAVDERGEPCWVNLSRWCEATEVLTKPEGGE